MEITQKIEKLKSFARENHIPIVRNQTIKKICEIIREEGYTNILEIGTAIGYSGIIMLNQNPLIKLTTIEKNEKCIIEAKNNFKDVGLSSRVRLIEGDAQEKLEKLKEENCKFDFIFLDGPKGQYYKYLPNLKCMLSEGGTIFTDNILLGGLLHSPEKVTHKNRAMYNNMNKFLSMLNSDSDFITEIYEIDDGFTISKLKKSAE